MSKSMYEKVHVLVIRILNYPVCLGLPLCSRDRHIQHAYFAPHSCPSGVCVCPFAGLACMYTSGVKVAGFFVAFTELPLLWLLTTSLLLSRSRQTRSSGSESSDTPQECERDVLLPKPSAAPRPQGAWQAYDSHEPSCLGMVLSWCLMLPTAHQLIRRASSAWSGVGDPIHSSSVEMQVPNPIVPEPVSGSASIPGSTVVQRSVQAPSSAVEVPDTPTQRVNPGTDAVGPSRRTSAHTRSRAAVVGNVVGSIDGPDDGTCSAHVDVSGLHRQTTGSTPAAFLSGKKIALRERVARGVYSLAVGYFLQSVIFDAVGIRHLYGWSAVLLSPGKSWFCVACATRIAFDLCVYVFAAVP
eukprot:Rmarinus@m.27421